MEVEAARGVLKDHLGLVVSLAISVFVVLRVLVVSAFDSTTALAVIQSVSPATVVFGMALQMMGSIALFVATYAGYTVWLWRTTNRNLAWWSGLAATAGVIALLTAPLLTAASSMFTMLAGHWFREARAKEGKAVGSVSSAPWVMSLILFIAVVLPALVFPPWLPPEVVTTTTEGDVFGYVLRDDGRWVDVLHAEPRHLQRFASSEVRDRELCDPKKEYSPLGDPLPTYWARRGLDVTPCEDDT
jgi:MFS family permease